jgi:hypothetical protein
MHQIRQITQTNTRPYFTCGGLSSEEMNYNERVAKIECIKFLKDVGFKKMETNSFANDYCNVVFEDNNIAVANNVGAVEYSKWAQINLYWLIGCLVRNSFIDTDKLWFPKF